MKQLLLLISLSSISFGVNAQTVLYESDDFTDWTVYNPSQFGAETYNSGDLALEGADPDTIRIDVVREFTSISGLDSIQVNFYVRGAGGADYLLDIYTSNDSINWTPVSITYDTPDHVDSISIYQSNLNTIGNSTFLRFQIRGYNYNLSGGMYVFNGHVYDVDIKTEADLTNSVDEIENDIVVFGNDGQIVVESESILESLEVFSLDGRLVYQIGNLNQTKTSISITENGIYVVNVNGTVFKKIYVQ